MKRTTIGVVTLAIAAAIAGWGAWALREVSPSAPLSAVDSSPVAALGSLELPDLDGKLWTLKSLQGDWTVINFWATWCAPCIEEMPELQKIGTEFASRGVVVVGLGIDNVAAMRRFRDDNKIAFPLLAAGASGTELVRQLGNPSGALPFTVLIDRETRVVERRLGRISDAELRRWLASRTRKVAG